MKKIEIPLVWVALAVLAIVNTILLMSNLKIENTQIASLDKIESSKLVSVGKMEEAIDVGKEVIEQPETIQRQENTQQQEMVEQQETIQKPEEKTAESDGIVVVIEEENTKYIEQMPEATVVDTITGQVQEEPVEETIPIEDVKISIDMDLTVLTGLSRNDFIELLANMRVDKSGFFEENAGLIYDLCHEYSINEIFFCGLIGEESGWNIADNHRRTHNYISLMSGGRLISYSTVEEGLEVAAQKLHNNYLTSGGKFYHGATLSGVKVCFCPASDTWVEKTFGRMKQVLN